MFTMIVSRLWFSDLRREFLFFKKKQKKTIIYLICNGTALLKNAVKALQTLPVNI